MMKKLVALVMPLLMIAVIIGAVGCTGKGGLPPTTTPTPSLTQTPQEAAKVILNQIETQVSGIRGLSSKARIEPQFVTKQELNDYMDKDFEENNPAEALRVEKAELSMLDLLPPNYDLQGSLLQLNEEQVIGFYDDETNNMVVLGNLSQINALEKVTFAHEYDHALEDHAFDLESLPLYNKDNSDLSLAAQSVAEGDATLVMMLYAYRYLGPTVVRELSQSTGGNNTVFDSSPPIIQETLLFPYVQGTQFVTSIFLRGGWKAVNQLYSDLPKSTEQILHPEKYLANEQPQEVTIPDLNVALGDEWSQLDSGVLGELYTRIYLEAFVDSTTATEASEGWGGDRYTFYEDDDKRDLLVLRSTWDTSQDAQEFFDAYLMFVHNKNKDSWTVLLNTQDKRWWNAPGQSVYLSEQGSDVLIILAPDENTVTSILPEFPGL